MRLYTKYLLDEYLKDDWILKEMESCMNNQEKEIRTNQWLMEIEAKRMIYADIYGDLLKNDTGGRRVLDVGGGVNSLTKILGQNTNYTLLDFLANGGEDYLESLVKEFHVKWLNENWYESKLGEYDIVIANDIFPDADQRVELFIDKMIPVCREIRLVLTFYNKPKFYLTQRVDDTEKLTFLSWDGEITGIKLMKYLDRMDVSKSELMGLKDFNESLYWNGRQVCSVIIKGDL